jgi:hypothetical protein
MALQHTLQIRGNIAFMSDEGVIVRDETTEHISFYVKVEKVSGDKNQVSGLVSFSSDTLSFTRNYAFTPNMNNDNFIKQAYLYLKTLPEFSGATDC